MAVAAGTEEIANFEVETQFLSFSPVTFVDAVINAVNDYSYDSSERMLEEIIKLYPNIDPAVLRQDVDKLLNFVQDAIDKYFDKFELYCLSNIFKVPAHIKLDSDLPGDDQGQDEDAKEVDKQIESARKRIKKATGKRAELREELSSLSMAIQKTLAEQKWSNAAAATCKKHHAETPRDHVQFLLKEVEKFDKRGAAIHQTGQGASLVSKKPGSSTSRKRPRIEDVEALTSGDFGI